MKITDSQVIKTGERELIDSISADLDWSAIEKIFHEEHNMKIEEDIDYKSGDIITHNNQIVYQLKFEVKTTLSVLLDREGNYISVSMSGPEEKSSTDESINNQEIEGTAILKQNHREEHLRADFIENTCAEALEELDSIDIPDQQ